ncbi:MAG: DUF4440 domain-containing protein [Planctomycetota bacterium]
MFWAAMGKNRRICFGASWMSALILGTGCALTGGKHMTREEIPRLLERQAQAWNGGDIDAFMVPYWHSPNLTFSSGGHVTRGWQATLERYRQRYLTREAMGCLTFNDLEVSEVGPGVALVLGRWRLERTEPIGGAFSLVLRKDAGKWVIVHDHTSVDAP